MVAEADEVKIRKRETNNFFKTSKTSYSGKVNHIYYKKYSQHTFCK
ncbi:hypothetical protein C900_04985 [Fulvivirga imtechensis AK7]|uniref:Uncharacterized protein n=1 Tax=Fulvivirga imtechensis AK7 TaxID=1237149 RepID=L8JMJ7_9BACT|nr:hypothetical protein C900_04985 [Fulvivirga imtechensis AK7]